MASVPVHPEWQVVLRNKTGHVVLYNSTSNEVSAVSPTAADLEAPSYRTSDEDDEGSSTLAQGPVASSSRLCPLCKQPEPPGLRARTTSGAKSRARTIADGSYFRLLSRASTPQASRPSTPPDSPSRKPSASGPRLRQPSRHDPLGGDKRADGYYARFFVEEKKLGRGQRGTVYLCRHVLDMTTLGYYAVKKVPVGQDSPHLLAVLKEVKHLELLHHPNIISYKHSWLESTSLGPHQPEVPVLFVLMDFANGGSLDAFLKARQGLSSGTTTPRTTGEDDEERRRTRQKTLFRQRRERSARPSTTKVVHLLNLDEIFSIFQDVCRGLSFLHSKGILHRDLKAENVLLTWPDSDAVVPTAAIADFGSAIGVADNWDRQRSGRTGTLDWVPPEAFRLDQRTGRLCEVTKKGDVWQLGLILHLLCFFTLPYQETEDIDRLVLEIQAYRGFAIPDMTAPDTHAPGHRLDLPLHLLDLLATLLNVEPAARPSCEAILVAMDAIRHEPVVEVKHHALVRQTSLTPPLAGESARSDSQVTGTGSTSSAIVTRPKPVVALPQHVDARPGQQFLISARSGRQLPFAVLVLFKTLLLAYAAPVASRDLYPVLTVLNVVELLVSDIRISAALLAVQAAALGRPGAVR